MAGGSYSILPAPPNVERPSSEIYEAMGEEGVFAMLEDFYTRLSMSEVADLFPKDHKNLMRAAHKSGAFFVGLLGGPPLYHQRHGSPMMRARHQPFAITPAAREEWLRCFDQTLEVAPRRFGFPEEHVEGFRRWLSAFSAWMVNTPDEPDQAASPDRGDR
jgi:hemoglobin